MWRLSWGNWWFLGCLAVFIVLAFIGEDCREQLETGTSCEGLSKTAHEDLGTIAVVLLLVAVVGIVGLGRLERLYYSRPCPRCGERVWTGRMECPRCEFDFRSIGKTEGG